MKNRRAQNKNLPILLIVDGKSHGCYASIYTAQDIGVAMMKNGTAKDFKIYDISGQLVSEN